MADDGGEGRPVEERGGQDVQRVEPAAGLADVLDDEVAREVVLEPLGVLEGVVHLRVAHRPGVEPHVEDVLDAAHGRLPRRVVRVGARQRVDEGPVQVGHRDTEVPFELLEGPVDVDPGVLRAVGPPHRDRAAPEAVSRDGPVPRIGQPLAELAVLDVRGRPGDLLVELEHPLLDLGHLDEPRGDRHVDERLTAAPAVRVAVVVGLAAQQDRALGRAPHLPLAAGPRLEVVDDVGVRVEDVHALVLGDGVGEAPVRPHRHDDVDAEGVGEDLVLLTEGGGDVDQAGAVLDRDVVRGQDDVALGMTQVVVEGWRVAAADELGPLEPLDHAVLERLRVRATEFFAVGGEPGFGDDVALRGPAEVGLDDDVVDVGVDGHRDVGRHGPRGGRPDECELTGLEAVADGHRRVLTHLVDVVVHPQLVVGQRGLVVPAVGQDPEALVDQPLVVERLEGPDDRLHVAGLERLVVVVEVDPPRLTRHVVTPLPRVLEHGGPAGVVEGVDAEVEDVLLRLEPELALRLELGGQAVGVPPEPALDAPAAHRLVARHDVLDVPGQQVPVVGQAVGEGGPVVEHELVGAVLTGRAVLDGGDEGAVLVPVLQDALLDLGEAGARRNARPAVDGAGRIGADLRVHHGSWSPAAAWLGLLVGSRSRGRRHP